MFVYVMSRQLLKCRGVNACMQCLTWHSVELSRQCPVKLSILANLKFVVGGKKIVEAQEFIVLPKWNKYKVTKKNPSRQTTTFVKWFTQ